MRRHALPILALVVTVALLLAAGTAAGTPASAAITLAPDPLNLAVGANGTIDVQISGAQDLGAFEFIIRFDAGVVQANGVTLGPMLGSTGNSATLLGPLVDNSAGSIRFAAYTLGSQPGPNGSGLLARVQFQGLRNGSSSLSFTKVRITDRAATVAQNVSANEGHIVVGSGNGPRLWLPLLRRGQ